MKPIFFSNQSGFRIWLEKYHKKEKELWVGYYKKDSGNANYSWSQTVDEALCFGWIDGIRKSINDVSYMIRFTPRKPKSGWSKINIDKVKKLTSLGLMHPAGIKAYNKRDEKNSKIYSFEQKKVKLKKQYELKFKANKKAWEFFQSLTPSTKNLSIVWVMSAKKEDTSLNRLNTLIKSSEEEKVIPPLRWTKKK
ncbi:MAG: YdeI/OmpD-associated family protein [Bacteroidetes bacterium]|nr:YdeI/OmpD-associated family protein [Bacteroidota bacterium]